MPTTPAPDDVVDQLAHGHELHERHPLVVCTDCGTLVVPQYVRTHEAVCPGAPTKGLTALARRVLGLKP